QACNGDATGCVAARAGERRAAGCLTALPRTPPRLPRRRRWYCPGRRDGRCLGHAARSPRPRLPIRPLPWPNPAIRHACARVHRAGRARGAVRAAEQRPELPATTTKRAEMVRRGVAQLGAMALWAGWAAATLSWGGIAFAQPAASTPPARIGLA